MRHQLYRLPFDEAFISTEIQGVSSELQRLSYRVYRMVFFHSVKRYQIHNTGQEYGDEVEPAMFLKVKGANEEVNSLLRLVAP